MNLNPNAKSWLIEDYTATMNKFIKDKPCRIASPFLSNEQVSINAVELLELGVNSDSRGDTIELMTTREGEEVNFTHSYQVLAEPGSLRGWIIHTLQADRLYFTQGDFEVELIDLNQDSSTLGNHMILRLGARRPARLTIPRLVAHSVLNKGSEKAAFINMPTRVYDPNDPDKYRFNGGIEELIKK
jgi:dTDP-4-dehydrorhamnose 3,5-epimerase